MGLDQRIGSSFLRAGIGYGGSCFPKDVSALKMLAGNTGYHFQLLNAVIEVNELQKRRVVGKLQKHLGSLVGKRVALLGLAFKPRHRRHARGLEPGAGRAAAGRGGRGRRLRPGRRRARPASCSTRSSCATRRWRRSRAPTPRCSSPSGPSSPSSTGPRRRADGAAAARRRPQLPRPDGSARGGLRVRGHRPSGRSTPAPAGDGTDRRDAGDRPGRRRRERGCGR